VTQFRSQHKLRAPRLLLRTLCLLPLGPRRVLRRPLQMHPNRFPPFPLSSANRPPRAPGPGHSPLARVGPHCSPGGRGAALFRGEGGRRALRGAESSVVWRRIHGFCAGKQCPPYANTRPCHRFPDGNRSPTFFVIRLSKGYLVAACLSAPLQYKSIQIASETSSQGEPGGAHRRQTDTAQLQAEPSDMLLSGGSHRLSLGACFKYNLHLTSPARGHSSRPQEGSLCSDG
jgi:hypothetical protein